MSNNGFPKESLELIRMIRGLDFIAEAHTLNYETLNKRNFENTLQYKEKGKYCFGVNYQGFHYKVFIQTKSNRPNPKYEKKIKRLF